MTPERPECFQFLPLGLAVEVAWRNVSFRENCNLPKINDLRERVILGCP
jgi:hypothetical protein